MIGLRVVRLALPLVLLAGGAAASSADDGRRENGTVSLCSMGFAGDTISVSCGNPEAEARLRARILTPEQARAAECGPMTVLPEAGPIPVTGEPTTIGQPSATPSVAARATDPAVAGRVNAAWDRIDRWLGAHASATLRELRFPASPAGLATLEKVRKLPDDLYVSLLRHDGADGNLGAGFQLPPNHGLAGVDDIWSLADSACRDLVMGGPPEAADPEHGRWHGSLVPFGSRGQEGLGSTVEEQELFVNPRDGRVGEASWNENVRYDGPMGWPNYATMLEAVADSLERNAQLRDWYPSVTPGCELRWVTEQPASLPSNCAGGPRPAETPTPTPTPTPTETELTAQQARDLGCRPDQKKPIVRPVDGNIAKQVDATWRRIERWLARKAPATHKTLPRPAGPIDIARAETAMGATFPDDLRASLLRHDGGGRFGPEPFYEYMSARAIHDEWELDCDTSVDIGDIGMGGWDGHLIPFASASDGGNLYLDPRTGRTGEYFAETGLRTDESVVWPSYLALLRDTAKALETGKPLRGYQATVTKGQLEWERAR